MVHILKDFRDTKCSWCGSSETRLQKTTSGNLRPHWDYDKEGNRLCQKCRCKEYYATHKIERKEYATAHKEQIRIRMAKYNKERYYRLTTK
jgi:uncharacterized SAM-dependent methyltransferase